ncbi:MULTISPECIES: copper resistance protein B [Acinetobacter]|jgi:copper resistance protein B|uniref:Copper resistance protein B n=1 Tax=Acinetobacter chengduensis TaxID=2420890 RepID=A0ABX9TST2_9GAMM|nr:MULTISPECIES: copper resistance protein B [Acinetobacter]MBI1453077.1 copper resistance protein B [Acinetobacter sp. FL51]RKG39596.1 copper resistance protein B [Acinetobacter sp. WCHAc060007]RLL19156.1 copper resistance protein B [Acinetobacter chengduensis]
MYNINLFSPTVLAQSVLATTLVVTSGLSQANLSAQAQMPIMLDQQHSHHNMMDMESVSEPKAVMSADMAMSEHSSSYNQVTHQQGKSDSLQHSDEQMPHEGHDHRKEHGAQVYAVTTLDSQWQLNNDDQAMWKTEFETKIGTDENKVFFKLHADKAESEDLDLEAKLLYSRMISDFWDAQVGVQYRAEKVQLNAQNKDTEENLDAVFGLHGLAPYFFETDAYFYVGADQYAAFSLETERDLLLTQKLILKPYLDLTVIFSDESKYAQKTGLSRATAGLEARYEISKKVMPYLGIAYEYSQGHAENLWQAKAPSDQAWLYGAGIRFKF